MFIVQIQVQVDCQFNGGGFSFEVQSL